MSTLQGFPMVSQLTTVTGDGRPSENAQYDCVAASIDAACRWLLNQPENSIFNPDNFKDHGAGQGYVGGTAAVSYIPFCQSLGIHLYPVQGNPGRLVSMARQFLAEGKPVIFTEPSPYASNWTHVCVFYQDEPGSLTAMDPFIARPVRKTDQEWLNLLLDNEIWIAELEKIMIDINTPGVGNYFTQSSPGWWTCKQTGKIVHGKILEFYQVVGGIELCGLTDLGLPKSNEIPLDTKGNTRQHFERGVLFFDPGHVHDNPPGAGIVYKAHLYGGPGQDPAVIDLENKLAKCQQQQTGLDPAKVKNFQQAASLEAHKIVQEAQLLESSLIVPIK